MNTVLFVNATLGFSENLFLVKVCSNRLIEHGNSVTNNSNNSYDISDLV